MATSSSRRELSYGRSMTRKSLALAHNGKVCKAKYGQLPCAAK